MLILKQFNRLINLDRAWNTKIFFILEETKETLLDFSQGTVKVLQMCYRIQFHCIIYFLSI